MCVCRIYIKGYIHTNILTYLLALCTNVSGRLSATAGSVVNSRTERGINFGPFHTLNTVFSFFLPKITQLISLMK